MNTFKIIPTVDSSIACATVSDETLTPLDVYSPAEYVVNDINCVISQMLSPDTSIDEALTVMRLSNRKSTLYIGMDSKLLGVISGFTLVSRVVLMVAKRKGVARADLTVADVMSLTYKMPALRKSQVHRACIGDIKQTMESLGEAHIQVLDENNKICGLISSTDISRVLHEPVYINATAHSFKDFFDVMHEHEELI
ncbi:CBS domain-containing protein [uncultured Paraglaciecola sp.]|uniref:CBS domain-containing protein n=1 Tax=uncultured Paraglaciecola sp. TaxID=1765024 RepID=UPI0030DA498A|tara:strand:- start:41014 stop:41601 length:588 start_codon:yes stop_codon:yes gene_type:complete